MRSSARSSNPPELTSCDDCALTKQDPIASCIIPADGRYFVLIRESDRDRIMRFVLFSLARHRRAELRPE